LLQTLPVRTSFHRADNYTVGLLIFLHEAIAYRQQPNNDNDDDEDNNKLRITVVTY